MTDVDDLGEEELAADDAEQVQWEINRDEGRDLVWPEGGVPQWT